MLDDSSRRSPPRGNQVVPRLASDNSPRGWLSGTRLLIGFGPGHAVLPGGAGQRDRHTDAGLAGTLAE